MGPTDYRQERLRDLLGAQIYLWSSSKRFSRYLYLAPQQAEPQSRRIRRRENCLNSICSHITGLEVKMHLSVTRVMVMCQPHTMTHGESEHQEMITLMITL